MLNVSPAYLEQLNSPQRTVEAQVNLIAQSNYNMSVNATATASDTKSSFFDAPNVIDGETQEPVAYLLLNRNCKLDGNWCLIGSDSRHNPGWWSQRKSDANGNFSPPYPYVLITYDPSINANIIRMATTTVYSGVSEVKLYLKYAGQTDFTFIGTYTFNANEYSKSAYLGDIKQIVEIKVEVTKTKSANDNAKLTEVEAIVEWSATSMPVTDYVLRYSITKSSGTNQPNKPAAPGIGTNSLAISFSRHISELAKPEENMIITVKQGFVGAMVDCGHFVIIGTPEETKDSWRCQAYSTLQLAKFFSATDLIFENKKTSDIARSILTALGIPRNKIEFNLSVDPVWEWYVVRGNTMDKILSDLADHFGVAIFQDETGTVIVKSHYGSSVFTITDAYIEDIQIIPSDIINAVTVHYAIIRKEGEDKVWELRDDITLQALSTASYVFPLNKHPAVNLKSPAWTDKSEGVENDINIVTWRSNGFYLKLVFSNTSSQNVTIPKNAISMLGKPLALSPERIYEASNEDSIRRLGRREMSTSLYCGSDAAAKSVGDMMLQYLNKAASVYRVKLNRPMPHLQLRDVVTIDSAYFGVCKDVVITNIDIDPASSAIECIERGAV